MPTLAFPASPTLNQTYTANGRSWTWDGTKWAAVSLTSATVATTGLFGDLNNKPNTLAGYGITDAATGASVAALAPVIQTLTDANATIATTTTFAALGVSITAARTFTLPAANAYATGKALRVADAFGSLSATLTLTLAAAGTDTLNGAANYVMSTPYAEVTLFSDGTSKWNYDVRGIGRGGTGSNTAAGARANLAVAGLADANTFTAQQTAVAPNATTPAQIVKLATTGSNAGIGLRVVDSTGAAVFNIGTASNGLPTIGNANASAVMRFDASGQITLASSAFYQNGGPALLAAGGFQYNSINGAALTGIGLVVYPSSAADKGLVVRGLASQTGNLLELQDSSGTSVLYITPSGNVQIPTNGVTANFLAGTGNTVLVGYSGVGLSLAASYPISWSSTAAGTGTKDIGLARSAAGVVKVTDGGTGYGSLAAAAVQDASGNPFVGSGVQSLTAAQMVQALANMGVPLYRRRVGSWYSTAPGGSSLGSNAYALNSEYASLYLHWTNLPIKGMSIVIAGAASGALVRLGIRAVNADGTIGGLLVDGGTVDGSTTGNKGVTFGTALSAGPNLYALTYTPQGSASCGVAYAQSPAAAYGITHPTAGVIPSANGFSQIYQSGVTSGLPATFTAVDVAGSGSAVFGLLF